MPAYYGIDHVDSTFSKGEMVYDTIYKRLRNFELTNQLGHTIDAKDISGKVVLASFSNTACDSCEIEMKRLKEIQAAFAKNDSSLQILTFSTEPQLDSASALKNYADHFSAAHDSWWFLTGNPSSIHYIIDSVLASPGSISKAHLENYPLETWVLVDKHQYIRGYYNAADSSSIRKCLRDIALLMLEREKR